MACLPSLALRVSITRQSNSLLGVAADAFDILRAVWGSVVAEDFVEPDVGLGCVFFMPSVPGVDGL